MQSTMIDILQRLKQLTAEKKIRWDAIDGDYECQYRGKDFRLQFITYEHPMFGSDRGFARVSAFKVSRDFAIGTEGYSLIEEIVAISNSEIIAWNKLVQSRLLEGLAFLNE